MQLVSGRLGRLISSFCSSAKSHCSKWRNNGIRESGPASDQARSLDDLDENELFDLWRNASEDERPRIEHLFFTKLEEHAKGVICDRLRETNPDLVQKCMVAVHQARPRFRGESKLSSWAHSIFLNIINSELRQRTRTREVFDESVGVPGDDDDDDLGLKWSQRASQDQLIQVEEVCRVLLPEEAILLQMKAERYTNEEIGEALKISDNAVDCRWRRLKPKLQEIFGKSFKAADGF